MKSADSKADFFFCSDARGEQRWKRVVRISPPVAISNKERITPSSTLITLRWSITADVCMISSYTLAHGFRFYFAAEPQETGAHTFIQPYKSQFTPVASRNIHILSEVAIEIPVFMLPKLTESSKVDLFLVSFHPVNPCHLEAALFLFCEVCVCVCVVHLCACLCVRAWVHLRDFCPSKWNNGCEGRAVALEISIWGGEIWGACIIQYWPNWRAGSCTQLSALPALRMGGGSRMEAENTDLQLQIWCEWMKCSLHCQSAWIPTCSQAAAAVTISTGLRESREVTL